MWSGHALMHQFQAFIQTPFNMRMAKIKTITCYNERTTICQYVYPLLIVSVFSRMFRQVIPTSFIFCILKFDVWEYQFISHTKISTCSTLTAQCNFSNYIVMPLLLLSELQRFFHYIWKNLCLYYMLTLRRLMSYIYIYIWSTHS